MTHRNPLRPAAFSLIEVLIAVTVLALGLLGLGMVFPVVIRQQRTAQDTVQGLSASRSASEYLRARRDVVTDLIKLGAEWRKDKDGELGFWLVPDNRKLGGMVFETGPVSGNLTLGDSATPQFIPVADRLSPAPFTSPSGPQFVWDFAIRSSSPETVEVAVFARRVDAGIRMPYESGKVKNVNLSHVLTGLPAGEISTGLRRVPVAVDRRGRPTLNGLDDTGKRNYSMIRTIQPVAGDTGDPVDLLRLSTQDATLLALARQPGQKLVDNNGAVHTVARASDTVLNGVLLEKALTTLERDTINLNPDKVQFLMTPQVPAAVTVVTLQK